MGNETDKEIYKRGAIQKKLEELSDMKRAIKTAFDAADNVVLREMGDYAAINVDAYAYHTSQAIAKMREFQAGVAQLVAMGIAADQIKYKLLTI